MKIKTLLLMTILGINLSAEVKVPQDLKKQYQFAQLIISIISVEEKSPTAESLAIIDTVNHIEASLNYIDLINKVQFDKRVIQEYEIKILLTSSSIQSILELIKKKPYQDKFIAQIKNYYRETDKFIKLYKTDKELPLFKKHYLSGRSATLKFINEIKENP